jgi:medium-chain acyl-[acyl-carrier-protein] hydrolase
MTTMQYTPLQHREFFIVRTYEIDNRKRATIPALVRLMHEAAMQNVIDLKLSVWDLEPQQISWVLMRKELHFQRLPGLGERIQVLTYPAGFERLFTYRDYRVFDEAGEQIAWSSSTWLLMNTENRRMTGLPPGILEYEPQMPDPGRCLPRPSSGKLPVMKTPEHQQHYQVNWFDLDFNNHLNNTLYLKWMLEALPDPLLRNGKVRKLTIHYRAESHWKDRVHAQTQQLGENRFLHRLVREEENGDRELASALSEWEA